MDNAVATVIAQESPYNTAQSKPNQWYASLKLNLARYAHGSRLASAERLGPLSVQKAFYPEGADCAHVYLLHPPAGIVSGDTLQLQTVVEEKAHALLTTPGANRFYRARTDISIGQPQQRQLVNSTVEKDGMLEYLPQETLIYPGAQAVSELDIHLHQQSFYLGWDIICLGLPGSGQPFNTGSFKQVTRVFVEQQLLYHDRLRLDQENEVLSHCAGLAEQAVIGCFLFYASQEAVSQASRINLLNDIRDKMTELGAQDLVSITDLNGLIVTRYLGEHGEQCKKLFYQIWRIVRPVYINKDACQPRVWFT
jgi:urease accessory protein